VLGEQVAGTTPEVARGPTNRQTVLGTGTSGTSPTSTKAPAAAEEARPATASKKLPFTGTDGIAVLLAGVLLLTAGLGLRLFAAHRA
jgi:hypothetical protein